MKDFFRGFTDFFTKNFESFPTTYDFGAWVAKAGFYIIFISVIILSVMYAIKYLVKAVCIVFGL